MYKRQIFKSIVSNVKETLAPDSARVVVSYNHVGRRTLTPEIVKEAMTVFILYAVSYTHLPSITEIKMIDTYWSAHCRHTTFGTVLDDVEIADANVQAAFDRYLELRHELGRDEKPVCLMDMGTIGAKWLKKEGILTGLDESEEINACTIKCKVDVDGEEQDWLYLFKNETHNHPTEIEPFGGCLLYTSRITRTVRPLMRPCWKR